MRQYSKAIAAAVAAFGTVMTEAVTDVNKGTLITGAEWRDAIVLALVTGAVTYLAPRNDPTPRRRRNAAA